MFERALITSLIFFVFFFLFFFCFFAFVFSRDKSDERKKVLYLFGNKTGFSPL